MPQDDTTQWGRFRDILSRLRLRLNGTRSVRVAMTSNLAESAREFVQHYFRLVRPELVRLGLDTKEIDDQCQALLRLTNLYSSRTRYAALIRAIASNAKELDVSIELALSAGAIAGQQNTVVFSRLETEILRTLEKLVPVAASSYRQAKLDMQPGRNSYRGPATDLRETLRGVLDALARDEDVMAEPWYQQNPDTNGPTMAQKTRYVLSSRNYSDNALNVPITTVNSIEEIVGRLVRTVYTRGAVQVHIGAQFEQVQYLKNYVDSVLAELLEIQDV